MISYYHTAHTGKGLDLSLSIHTLQTQLRCREGRTCHRPRIPSHNCQDCDLGLRFCQLVQPDPNPGVCTCGHAHGKRALRTEEPEREGARTRTWHGRGPGICLPPATQPRRSAGHLRLPPASRAETHTGSSGKGLSKYFDVPFNPTKGKLYRRSKAAVTICCYMGQSGPQSRSKSPQMPFTLPSPCFHKPKIPNIISAFLVAPGPPVLPPPTGEPCCSPAMLSGTQLSAAPLTGP